ncbi:MAG TPA: FMN-binding negative transcriptional regulator [Gemmatimonadaceae bacterium]
MYVPNHFAQPDSAALHELMRAHPFATFVVATPSGLEVNHVPFVIDAEPAPLGTLRAHVARGNPVWRALGSRTEAVVVFHGPDHYISPSWYPSKQELDGKVVPTWNYAVVHAHGPAMAIEDRAWLERHLAELVRVNEAGRSPAWEMSDAPADFIEKMVGAVVGIEIPVRRLVGKWKLNQNRSAADRESVVVALEADGSPGALSMAGAMRRTLEG